MGAVRFAPPTREALQFIADNMRQADAVEVMASGGYTSLEALEASVEASKFSTVMWVGDIPCTVFGLVVRDILSGTGVPWMLSAEQLLKHRRLVLGHSPMVLREMLGICPFLHNQVHSENKVSLRWLKWLGFQMDDPKPTGVKGEMFHRFHLTRDEYV